MMKLCSLSVSLLLLATAPLPLCSAENAPELLTEALKDFERYAESIWHDAPAMPDSGYFGDGKSNGNGGIRGTCGTAMAYAVLILECPDDLENPRRLKRVEAALRYASNTHKVINRARCIDEKNWGYGWQTALWSGSLGFTCALLQDRLPPKLVENCKKVVAAEASRLTQIPPPSGNRGDSKAEENAWNSNSLALAAAWIQSDQQAQWLRGARTYMVNTYTVPNLEGDPLREWIRTTNLLPSFAMENHGFFHPSYQMVSGMSLGDSLLMAQTTNPAVAEELRPFAEHNVLPTWACLEHVILDNGELGYPSGLDWSLHGYGQISYYAWLATHFQNGEAYWACLRLARLIRQRQKVNGDGRFTGESCRNGFYREAVGARRTALALLHFRHAEKLPTPVPPAPFVSHLPDVKLLLQRSAQGFIGISYGSRVMAVLHPTSTGHEETPFVTSPRSPGLLTLFGNRPGKAQISDVKTADDGFSCTFDLSDGLTRTTRTRVVSSGDSLALVEISAGDFPDKPAQLFPVGIENHPLTGKDRLLQWTGGEKRVPERSGEQHNLPTAVSISQRLGMIAGPQGKLLYTAPNGYNRSGAAEDTLAFVSDTPRKPSFAILLPDADLATTQQVQESINFQKRGDMLVLRYRSPRGKQVELALPDAPPAVPYSRLRVPCKVKVANHHLNYPGANMVDGDPKTFWVSSPDGKKVEPGCGPTATKAELVVISFARVRIDGILLTPRPRYGPRRLSIAINGEKVFSGTMRHGPLPVLLKKSTEAETLTLTITQAYDPRFPNNSRNVQIAEIALLQKTK